MGKTPQTTQAILDTKQHSISYTLNRNQAVIVEYQKDDSTDLFQIGRSSESPIDFVVMDTIPGNKVHDPSKAAAQSTISRFACRIISSREETDSAANIFAAGFDSSRNIFLGEKATKWETEHHGVDGLTTNGVLIMHPQTSFCGADDPSKVTSEPGVWREVSVGGGIYGLRESRSAPTKGRHIPAESSELIDGTLVDICGATLLWRSHAGLARSPTNRELELLVDNLNAGRPQCPVGLTTHGYILITNTSALSNSSCLMSIDLGLPCKTKVAVGIFDAKFFGLLSTLIQVRINVLAVPFSSFGMINGHGIQLDLDTQTLM